jgi:molybdenum cofactor cytidylyltransferase
VIQKSEPGWGTPVNLHNALRLSSRQAVAFVGAGGKSAAIAALVNDLEGIVPIAVTTTTHLAAHQADITIHQQTGFTNQDRLQVEQALNNAESILVTGGLNDSGDKWIALKPRALQELWALVEQLDGILLIEADGARRKWLKAPAEHEPAIPAFVDLVVPIAGMHAWQREISPEVVHRPEILSGRLLAEMGTPLDETHLISWAVSPDLAFKNVPSSAEVRILLNQADNSRRLEAARRVAQGALKESIIAAVVVANIGRRPETVECIVREAGVVLAAGGSSRVEGKKLLFEWRGKPLVRHVVENGLEAGLDPVTVVAGSQPEDIQNALSGLPVRVVINPDWEQGQSASVRQGLNSIDSNIEGAVFLLADMPLVSSKLIQELIRTHRASLSPIVAPQVGERWGNPVLFDRQTFDELMRLEGDRGGRALFDSFAIRPVTAGNEALFDCDTQEDMAWLVNNYP